MIIKRTGVNLANAHRSVASGTDVEKVYDTIARAIHRDSKDSIEKQNAIRLHAINLAFERINNIGKRKNEDFRVSVADHSRMDAEYHYLKEKLNKLVGDRHYNNSLSLEDNRSMNLDTPLSVESVLTRLDRVVKGVFDNKVQVVNFEDVAKNFNNTLVGLDGDDPERVLNLIMQGPDNYLQSGLPEVHSIHNIRDEIDFLNHRLSSEGNGDFIRSATDLAASAILNNPVRALMTHADEILEKGRILLG